MNTLPNPLDDDIPPIPPELLEEFPGHLHPELLPEDVSLDFAMTKDNLFAVWSLPTERQKLIMNHQGPDIELDWVLADAENTLEQIQKFYGGMKVVACISLAELENTVERLEKPSFWKSVFSTPKVYFVETNDDRKWSQKKEGKALFEGDLSDIENILKEGKKILNDKQYKGIGDARGVQEGHPRDWIRFMVDAKDGAFFRVERLKHLGHDGSD